MIHHPGEVLEIFKPNDSDTKSADEDTLATLRMWDENILTLVVDPKITNDVRVGDKVFVDYRPITVPSSANTPIIAKQVIAKVIKGKRAEAVWKEYKKFFEQQRQKPQTLVPRPQESYIG
ncbi:MAG: hypothetical protein HY361_01285 [Candidatus Aenigmarchaeota archaeon]|nr:hypothetical protein [Candidatus Aenigmarchaeota archaeon]